MRDVIKVLPTQMRDERQKGVADISVFGIFALKLPGGLPVTTIS